MSTMRKVAELQEAYQRLIDEKRLPKRAMCDLCIPFWDKYGLKDSQALRITRKEMDLAKMLDLLEALEDDTPWIYRTYRAWLRKKD